MRLCQHGSHAWACVTCSADHVAKIRATHPSQQLSADAAAGRIQAIGEELHGKGYLTMCWFRGAWEAGWRGHPDGEAKASHATFTGALRALVRELEKRTERRSA